MKSLKEVFDYMEVNYLGLGGISEMYEAKTSNGEIITLKLNFHNRYIYKKVYKGWKIIGKIGFNNQLLKYGI